MWRALIIGEGGRTRCRRRSCMHVRTYDTPYGSMCVHAVHTSGCVCPHGRHERAAETIRVSVEIAQMARKSTLIDGGYVRSSREIRQYNAKRLYFRQITFDHTIYICAFNYFLTSKRVSNVV